MRHEELDQIIDKSLKAEPQFKLSADFAQKVVMTVVRRKQWKADLREYLSISAVLLSLLALVLGFYYFVNKDIVLQVFHFVTENTIPVILIAFLLNFIFFADRVLLRLLFNRWSKTFDEN
jgi:hypothetical protein